jgi:hypothetical protein
MIFDDEPEEVFATRSASAACRADLMRKQFSRIKEFHITDRICFDDLLFSLPSHLRLEFCFLGEFSVCLTSLSSVIKVLLLDAVKDASKFRCCVTMSIMNCFYYKEGTYQANMGL